MTSQLGCCFVSLFRFKSLEFHIAVMFGVIRNVDGQGSDTIGLCDSLMPCCRSWVVVYAQNFCDISIIHSQIAVECDKNITDNGISVIFRAVFHELWGRFFHNFIRYFAQILWWVLCILLCWKHMESMSLPPKLFKSLVTKTSKDLKQGWKTRISKQQPLSFGV